MLENDINKLELNSLGQAVYFHTMFKFKPIIQDPDNIAGFITYNILCRKGDNRFEKIVNKAENWLNRHEKNSKESINEGNEIIYEYCTNVIKHKLHKNNDYQISTGGFDMVLKKDDVLKNKDFFNGLFKKFHIDYEIE